MIATALSFVTSPCEFVVTWHMCVLSPHAPYAVMLAVATLLVSVGCVWSLRAKLAALPAAPVPSIFGVVEPAVGIVTAEPFKVSEVVSTFCAYTFGQRQLTVVLPFLHTFSALPRFRELASPLFHAGTRSKFVVS